MGMQVLWAFMPVTYLVQHNGIYPRSEFVSTFNTSRTYKIFICYLYVCLQSQCK
jgi:hypothetical protein